MSITDTHRKLGVGEKIQWGDIWIHLSLPNKHNNITVDLVDGLITEDTPMDFYRPLIRETSPHIFEAKPLYDERNAPEMVVLEDSKSEVLPERAKTDDSRKAPLAQLPWAALREMAYVQQYGHQKYGDFHNYRKGMEVSRNLSCAIRHIAAYMDGENLDPESQCSHLGHAMCRLGFVLQNLQDGTAIDDRYKGGAK